MHSFATIGRRRCAAPFRKMLVPDGRITVTFGVLQHIPMEDVLGALDRHARATLSEREPRNVGEALRGGPTLVSIFESSGGMAFWVLTEGERPAVTVLLPDEY